MERDEFDSTKPYRAGGSDFKRPYNVATLLTGVTALSFQLSKCLYR